MCIERLVSIVAQLHIRLTCACEPTNTIVDSAITQISRHVPRSTLTRPGPARLHFPIPLHRPLSCDGVDHREVSQLALEKRTFVDVLVPVDVRARVAVSPTGDRDGLPHHPDVAPEFAFDLVPDFAELVGARSAGRCVCVRKVPRRAGWGSESER